MIYLCDRFRNFNPCSFMQKIIYINKTYIEPTKNNYNVLFIKIFGFGASNLAMKTPDR